MTQCELFGHAWLVGSTHCAVCGIAWEQVRTEMEHLAQKETPMQDRTTPLPITGCWEEWRLVDRYNLVRETFNAASTTRHHIAAGVWDRAYPDGAPHSLHGRSSLMSQLR